MSPIPTSSSSSRSRSRTALAAALLIGAAGCATETRDVYRTTPPPRAMPPAPQLRGTPPPSNASNLDPCAMRLHDVVGGLLLYYFHYQRLPATLGDLNATPGVEQQVPLACPTSNEPYVYSLDGIQLPEQNARIIVHDATPAHYGGYRWAIRLEDPREDRPLVARVVALPETFFTFKPPVPSGGSR